MPIFAGIGAAILGAAGTAAAGATATAVVGALAIGATAAAVGTSIYSSQSQATAAKKQAGAFSAMLASQAQNVVAPGVGVANVGAITGQEAQETVAKRMARVGKYFTSPLGDTSALSTASQKVFS